jgi:hypothetical protein
MDERKKMKRIEFLLTFVTTILIITGVACIPYYAAILCKLETQAIVLTWLLGFLVTVICFCIVVISSMCFVGAQILNK